MGEYKKITKDDINLPQYCLFFIKKIQEAIENEGGLDKIKTMEVSIETTYPYCSDAFELIAKAFASKKIDLMPPTFKVEYKFNIKTYVYKCRLQILGNIDDLPF